VNHEQPDVHKSGSTVIVSIRAGALLNERPPFRPGNRWGDSIGVKRTELAGGDAQAVDR
jgi:hypothetical protein